MVFLQIVLILNLLRSKKLPVVKI